MMQIVIIVFISVVILVLASLYERQRLCRFFERGCAGFRWKRRFPQASNAEIREFLDIFAEAFGYPRRWRLYFAPEDQVMELYQIRYPVRGEPDGMELEDLVEGLKKRYGFDAVGLWREDITIGDLFEQAGRPAA